MIKEQDFEKYSALSIAIYKCCHVRTGLSAIVAWYGFNTRQRNKFNKCEQLLNEVVSIMNNERDKILKGIPGTISEQENKT